MNAWFALSRSAVIGGFLLFGVLTAEGCDCGDILNPVDEGDGGVPLAVCELADNEDCEGNDVLKQGECRPSGCEADTDCCPGTRCRLDLNTCWPHLLDGEYACESDADCPDPAQRCQEVAIGPRDPLPVCVYERCETDADCGEARSCFHTVCVDTAPCGGGCADGEVCDVLTGQCAVVPEHAVGCDQACDGLRVLSDPDLMAGEICCPSVCSCRTLPPLIPKRFGRFARVALSGGEILISAYDAEYGDLVLVSYKDDGSFSRIRYLDGVPAGAPQVAAREGPRGGVAEPGPDVGTHTSIATDASGQWRIAYHDIDNRSLKIALEGAGGVTTYTLDSPPSGSAEDAQVGLFTDMAIDPEDGTIWISYLVDGVTNTPGNAGPANGLKVARSLNASPQSAADWQLVFADTRGPADPCQGTCGAGEACVLDGEPLCRTEAMGCSGCGPSEICAALDGPDAEGNTEACFPPPLPTSAPGMPRARGLHTSVAINAAQEAVVAYYDAIDGDLRLARVDDNGGAISWLIDGDGEGVRRSGDVGRFPSLFIDGGAAVVTYNDFARHQLRMWRGAPGATGVYQTLDDGAAAPGPGMRFVGAGASIAPTESGPMIVFQDATTLDLKLARVPDEGPVEVETLLTEGAHGFYSDLAVGAEKVFLVSVEARLDDRGQERSRLTVLPRALP